MNQFSLQVLLVLKCRFAEHITKRNECSGEENGGTLVPRGRSPFGQHQSRSLSQPWECPTPEARESRISRHTAHAQSQV